MSATEDAESLRLRTIQELETLSDFLEHTSSAWEQFGLQVQGGHGSPVHNALTGKETSASDILTRVEQYTSHYLRTFSFLHLTAIFETFFFDLLKIILVNNPIQLGQKKQIEVGFALSAPDRSALVNLIAERELNEIKYRKPSEWFQYLDTLVHLGCPSADEIANFSEMKVCRDVLAHNAGMVNPVYIDKAGAKARWAVGERIVIEPPYFRECWQLSRKLADELSSRVKNELAGPAP